MADVKAAARTILSYRVPYLSALILSKALALLVGVVQPGTTSWTLLLQLCVAFTTADIALRVAASRGWSLSLGKHGTDLLLVALLLGSLAACGGDDPQSELRYCRGLKLLLPFALLVSAGGNMMRLGSAGRSGRESVQAADEAADMIPAMSADV
eukprot:TRINITY_DN44072_c0_g1_i3.p1 TRINITY_DN44072_c0_g1~~TRINITY_DN44072_c0_g1_i3.p1  ORF type:complete len:154 (-),score=17.69 TRINITY_DN44072_c0_g1_i3:20-481(-)